MHEKSIDLLNRAIADELTAVHQYMYFHFHCDDQGYDLLAGLFKQTAIEEMLHIERLAERGNRLRMPASKPLGDGLFELRFDLGPVAWRIPFFFATGRRIVLLTVFRKQRMNERTEITRARAAMVLCIAEGHTAEED